MRRILILGGTGFVGRHLTAALTAAGHRVEAWGRRDLNLAQAIPDLTGVDLLINAAGLARDQSRNPMAALHAAGPARLAAACTAADIPLIHFSALGANAADATGYQRSKGAGEAALRAQPGLRGWILRPSLVIGRGGFSTGLFTALAAPFWPLRLGAGTWRVQPIAVADVAELVVRLVDGPAPDRLHSLDLVGPEPLTTDQLTAALRAWLGRPPRRPLSLPLWALRLAARVGGALKIGPLSPETLTLLQRGNVGDPAAMTAALGRAPRPISQALSPAAPADRAAAGLFWVRPLLRWSLAGLWIATGLLSFGLYPIAESHRLLAQLGAIGAVADLALYGGAALDLTLGLLLLFGRRPAAVGVAMLASVAAFTLISFGLPLEHWTHPFAPILKNAPIAAAILVMIALGG